MRNNNAMVFYNEKLEPCCGTEGVFITELKTIKGIVNRIKPHITYMANKGYTKYILISYNEWMKYNTEELMKLVQKGNYKVCDTKDLI